MQSFWIDELSMHVKQKSFTNQTLNHSRNICQTEAFIN